jgi:hypothetical protein
MRLRRIAANVAKLLELLRSSQWQSVRSFDHLVGTQQTRLRDSQPKRHGGFEVDN